MKNPLELIQFGREISDNYVRDNVPLTQSLEKIAQTHNLNKQEMHRVAETANVETYLKMIEKSNDKYVEFPVADASKVYDEMSTKTAARHEKYFNS
jgi:pantothenate kinase